MFKKAVVILLALGLIFIYGRDLVAVLATGDMNALKEIILRGGYWAPLISFTLIIIQAFISPLPSVLIFIVNGIVFGALGGFLISWMGSLCSALLCFALIRYLGLNFQVPPRVLTTVIKLIQEHQEQSVFVARVLPVVPFDLASYAFALTGISLKNFLVGTAFGQTPAILFYTLWGRSQYPWYINFGGILIWTALGSLLYYTYRKITIGGANH